ncbi:MAG: hypothetical protein ACYC91_09605 [Solirubrobacteraceae bacterium]
MGIELGGIDHRARMASQHVPDFAAELAHRVSAGRAKAIAATPRERSATEIILRRRSWPGEALGQPPPAGPYLQGALDVLETDQIDAVARRSDHGARAM